MFICLGQNESCLQVGGEKKCERMSWALAEGHLDILRAAAKASEVTAMYQDASGKRMASRFSAIGRDGQCQKGLVRILHNCKNGSEGIAQSTLKALEMFSTPRVDHAQFGAPHRSATVLYTINPSPHYLDQRSGRTPPN